MRDLLRGSKREIPGSERHCPAQNLDGDPFKYHLLESDPLQQVSESLRREPCGLVQAEPWQRQALTKLDKAAYFQNGIRDSGDHDLTGAIEILAYFPPKAIILEREEGA